MTLRTGLDAFLVLVPLLAVGYLVLLFWMARTGRLKAKDLAPAAKAEIEDALAIYLCGNRDLTRLQALMTDYPDNVCDILLQYHERVGGYREELCELAIALGYVEAWWWDAQSQDLAKRRQAFSRIAAIACHEPVRQLVRDVTAKAAQASDELIRLEVARIRLASGDASEVTQVFEAALMETPAVRSALSDSLREHAVELCENAIPWALRAENPLELLKMLVSWERSLPLTDVGVAASHPQSQVRLEAMRLVRYLPATAKNLEAIQCGLASEDPEIRAAAHAAHQPDSSREDWTAGFAASPAQ
jgi:hypothetical protein